MLIHVLYSAVNSSEQQLSTVSANKDTFPLTVLKGHCISFTRIDYFSRHSEGCMYDGSRSSKKQLS